MVHESLQSQAPKFDNEKFNMWRCIVAMAHADNIVMEDEKEYLKNIFDKMKDNTDMAEEHYQILLEDIETPQNVDHLMADLNAPECQSQVVYFARVLAHKDGNLHPTEAQLIEKLRANALEGKNLEEIKKQVASNIQEEMVAIELEGDSQRETTGPFGVIDKIALKLGIDLMD